MSYLNKKEFFDRWGKVTDTTFSDWVEKGYLPGVVPTEDGTDWYIPERTWRPYTDARATDVNAIYTSIVKGCLLQRRPIAEIYKCSQQEFDIYIDELVQADLIRIEIDGGINYYYATLKSEEYANRSKRELSKFVKSCLSTIIEAGAKGITEAAIKYSTMQPALA